MKTLLKKLFLLLLLISAQASSAQISTKEVALFFEELDKSTDLRINQIDKKVLKWEHEDIYFKDDGVPGIVIPGLMSPDSLKKYLSEEDFIFIDLQYKLFHDTSWRSQNFKNFKLLDESDLDKIYKNSLKRKSRKYQYSYSFSLPLFSEDRKTVIFKQVFYCGFLCSTECIYLYRKSENNIWIEVGFWNCSAS
jgi:hypothetical protein